MKIKNITKEIGALSVGVTSKQLKAIETAFDCFTRSDINDEVILDCSAFGDEEIAVVTEATGSDCTPFMGFYVILYIDETLS